MVKAIQLDLEFLVMHRPNFDAIQLADVLQSARKRAHLTISQVADSIGVTKTEAEHWFRKDRWNSPPTVETWPKIKKLLNIEGWDVVGDFYYLPNVFEMGGRAYHEIGLSPTVQASEPPWVAVFDKCPRKGEK